MRDNRIPSELPGLLILRTRFNETIFLLQSVGVKDEAEKDAIARRALVLQRSIQKMERRLRARSAQ